jgi:16S rRNA G1207 methylase RsmC
MIEGTEQEEAVPLVAKGGRPRQYADAAERQRAFHARRRAELEALRAKVPKPRHPRHDSDVYHSPPAFVCAGLDRVTVTPARILDPGAGEGAWGIEARRRWPDAHLIGVDIRPLPQPAAYDEWHTGDLREILPRLAPVDLVIGNPPYRDGLAEEAVRAGLALLLPGGELLFLLRLAFREGKRRNRGLFQEHPLVELGVCDRRPRFYGFTSGMTAFGYFLWRAGWTGETRQVSVLVPP